MNIRGFKECMKNSHEYEEKMDKNSKVNSIDCKKIGDSQIRNYNDVEKPLLNKELY